MPTLFDSHAEFNEWFSKDIEGRSDKKTGISESECAPQALSNMPSGLAMTLRVLHRSVVTVTHDIEAIHVEKMQGGR